MSVTLPDGANQEAKVCLMVCRVTAYRLSPSSGARLSFLTAVWKQAGIFSNAVFLRGCWKMGSAGLRVYAWSIRIISSGTRTNTRFPPF